MAKISQREAHKMRKELRALHERDADRERRWSSDYPGAVNIASSRQNVDVLACINTARLLGHAVICTTNHDGQVLYYASKTK